MTEKTLIITASSFATSNVLGGHYRSAAAIASLLKNDYKVILLNVGARPSPVMATEGVETLFYEGRPEWPGPLRSKIAGMIEARGAHAFLAFDQKAGELVRPLARRKKLGFVLVKPGGGQPRLYYPKADHNVVFMPADARWLTARNPARSSISLAAGRIYAPEQDLDAQSLLRAELGLSDDDMAIVRIGRLHEHYSAVNRAALALAARLRAEGLSARMILIGTAQSPNEYRALDALKGADDAILSDDRFTNQASRLLGMFRYNVGTGRGFMEGAALGQVMFCASQYSDGDLPLLVSDDNFQNFFDENFSPRIRPDVSQAENLNRIFEMAQHQTIQARLSTASRHWFEDFFSAESSKSAYKAEIETATSNPEGVGVDHFKSEVHLRSSVLLDRLRTWIAR